MGFGAARKSRRVHATSQPEPHRSLRARAPGPGEIEAIPGGRQTHVDPARFLRSHRLATDAGGSRRVPRGPRSGRVRESRGAFPGLEAFRRAHG
ncbi:MAG: hypothetical protein EBY09_20085, partial [Verrucomicrobia bacterium]|nr:hypothetical protein [Verrucomicrobiota bacterium]NDD40646.1 hypothetical protein [Verrucomicrobiota bacterium]NDF00944.1 hypothetical protein [Verrucomicrobiota bacterium]